MGEHSHVDVVLTVSCRDASEASAAAEKLARVMTGLALDGHDAWLNLFRWADVDEEGRVIEP